MLRRFLTSITALLTYTSPIITTVKPMTSAVTSKKASISRKLLRRSTLETGPLTWARRRLTGTKSPMMSTSTKTSTPICNPNCTSDSRTTSGPMMNSKVDMLPSSPPLPLPRTSPPAISPSADALINPHPAAKDKVKDKDKVKEKVKAKDKAKDKAKEKASLKDKASPKEADLNEY